MTGNGEEIKREIGDPVVMLFDDGVWVHDASQNSASVPHLCLKAQPATEGDRRFIYCVPSNENRDIQSERLLQAALMKSRDHFLKHGNLDIDHLSLIGPKLGMTPAEAKSYEVGVPVDVAQDGEICVKGEVYRGDGIAAKMANWFWDSLHTDPPHRYWPSVGGRTLDWEPSPEGDRLIKAVEWTNLAFAREPVNRTVKAVSLLPLEPFCKAITAGFAETDTSKMSGGRAVQLQSMRGEIVKLPNFEAAATRFLKAYTSPYLLATRCEHSFGGLTKAKIAEHFERCEKADPKTAEAYADRLLRDMEATRLRNSHHEERDRRAALAA
jgi:hypothetical protein